jgi:hypothetical protein
MVTPRISLLQRGSSELGKRAVDLAAEAGLTLDDWQAYSLEESLRVRKDGRWAAFEFGECVPRQNGKGGIIEARLLAALDIVKSNLSIYSAHNFDTATEHQRRIEYLITETPRLNKQLAPRGIKHSHGQESIEFKGNRRITFRTRTKTGARGFACDGVLILDEAMVISEAMHGALFPILSGKTLEKPGPQIWYTGSAVDQLVHEHGVVFSRLRERAIKGEAERLGYLEWSVEGDNPTNLPPDVAGDKAAWAKANPALGVRIALDYIEQTEFEAMDRRTFAVERLGVGDWPRTDHVSTTIDVERFAELEDASSQALDPVCFAFDVSPERMAAVAAAGRRSDGNWHVEVIASRRGTAWVPEYLAERVKRNKTAAVVCDGYGPASRLIPALEALGIEVEAKTAQEHAASCGRLVDAIEEGTLRYPTDPSLVDAVRAAQTRPLGDAWAWSRKSSASNISPLVAVTLALSAAQTMKARKVAFAFA